MNIQNNLKNEQYIKCLAEELPNGYRPFTTFFSDLDIAEKFGVSAIVSIYDLVLKEWSNDYKYMTEFILCLFIKCEEHYHSNNEQFSACYRDLAIKCENWYLDKFDGNHEAIHHFFCVLD